MKNKFQTKKVGIAIIATFFFFSSFSQSTSKHLAPDKLVNTWYEWPHQGKDGNAVFFKTPYVPVPGIDKQDNPFGKLIISNDGSFTQTQYCGYCPNTKLEEKNGSLEVVDQSNTISGLKISFPNEASNTFFKVISYTEEKLVLNMEQSKNTK